MEFFSPIIVILGIICQAVVMFFALKSQVDKLSHDVNTNTEEVKKLRKTLESTSEGHDSEISVLKKRFEEILNRLKSISHRLSEVEKNLDIK